MSMFLAQENLHKTLETGVTTVRNLHAADYTDIAMRELISTGKMTGPRMFVSGYGLHVASRPGAPTPSKGQANGVAEVERAAREQINAGADWVKMFGSTGSAQDVSGNQTYTFEEMKAAVDTAHGLGKRDRDSFLWSRWRARCGASGRRLCRTRDRHGRRNDCRDGATQDVLCSDYRSQSLLRRVPRSIRIWPRGRRAVESLRRAQSRDRPAGVQSGSALCDGFRRSVHDVRTEHSRAGVVCKARNDATNKL